MTELVQAVPLASVEWTPCNRPYAHPAHKANIVTREGNFWCPGVEPAKARHESARAEHQEG